MKALKLFALVLLMMFAASPALAAGKKSYHCEVKKGGKHVDLDKKEAPNRKECKKKGGKWVKDHDHDHGEDGEDHDHDEEE